MVAGTDGELYVLGVGIIMQSTYGLIVTILCGRQSWGHTHTIQMQMGACDRMDFVMLALCWEPKVGQGC